MKRSRVQKGGKSVPPPPQQPGRPRFTSEARAGPDRLQLHEHMRSVSDHTRGVVTHRIVGIFPRQKRGFHIFSDYRRVRSVPRCPSFIVQSQSKCLFPIPGVQPSALCDGLHCVLRLSSCWTNVPGWDCWADVFQISLRLGRPPSRKGISTRVSVPPPALVPLWPVRRKIKGPVCSFISWVARDMDCFHSCYISRCANHLLCLFVS